MFELPSASVNQAILAATRLDSDWFSMASVFDDETVVPLLRAIRRLTGPPPRLAHAAYSELVRRGDSAAITEALSCLDRGARAECVPNRAPGPVHLATLLAMIEHQASPAQLRRLVMRSLISKRPKNDIVPVMGRMLADSDWQVAAYGALGLQRFLNEDPDARRALPEARGMHVSDLEIVRGEQAAMQPVVERWRIWCSAATACAAR